MQQEYRLDDEQLKDLEEWSKHCDTYAGAIGGRITIEFTETGLGTCATARCICGEKIDLTDVSDW